MAEVQKISNTYSLLKKLIGLTLGLTLFSFSGFVTSTTFCSEKSNHTELRVSLSNKTKSPISFKSVVQQLHTACFICYNEPSLIFSIFRFEQIIEIKTLANSKELHALVKPDEVLKTIYAARISIDTKSNS